ncbi:MAG: hypothetical protein V7K53_02265 [Nostoc sp.]
MKLNKHKKLIGSSTAGHVGIQAWKPVCRLNRLKVTGVKEMPLHW